MKPCESCGEERPRRKCSKCGAMVCGQCSDWFGSSRSSYPATAECRTDCADEYAPIGDEVAS